VAFRFGTAEWAQALHDEINGSSEYRNAAKEWGVDFNGNLVFAFEADAALAQPLYLFLALKAGSCSVAEFVPGPDRSDVGFVLRAPFRLWRDILERKTMAATAILTGKMSVEGSKMTLLKHTSSSRALIHCTASVDTEFPE
jgi:putative sterol carrier protein